MELLVKRIWFVCALFCAGYGVGSGLGGDWITAFVTALGGLCFLGMINVDHDDIGHL